MPPCHEKNQLLPSVVTPCERMSVSCQRTSSAPTCFQAVVQAAPASAVGTTSASAASRPINSPRGIQQENAATPPDLASDGGLDGRPANSPLVLLPVFAT